MKKCNHVWIMGDGGGGGPGKTWVRGDGISGGPSKKPEKNEKEE